ERQSAEGVGGLAEMRREPREIQEGRITHLFAGLERQISTPSEQNLRSMARNASSRSRPLPAPVPSRRWPLQARWTGVLVLALVVATGLGVGLGALIAPSGTAASGPVGTGFLPGPGWTVLQTGADATPERQALAVATNVPLHPEDSARGIRNSSGLPYSTLLKLPPRGVVIVALFTLREPRPWFDEDFPEHDLPLRVREAVNSISYMVQVRPERPLGQYQIRATVGRHYVDVQFYVGTRHPSPELIDTAQRQLDRLVVASTSAGTADSAPRPNATAAPSASTVIDRTVSCAITRGGTREIDVRAQSGTRLFGDRSKWKSLPGASFGDPRSASPTSSHVYAYVSAGWPPPRQSGLPLRTDTLAYSIECRPSSAPVPLSTVGLSGGAASPNGDEHDCVVAAKILVRIRGVYRTPTSLKRSRDSFVARGPVKEGYLAIRTLSGDQIALATVLESGRARLFVGDSCGPSG
ncbi:MAG: hypothetical protein WD044_02685, partial [Dongiaceae bacterium]